MRSPRAARLPALVAGVLVTRSARPSRIEGLAVRSVPVVGTEARPLGGTVPRVGS